MDGPLQSLFCVGLLTLPLVLLATGCSPAKPTASDVLRPVKTMVVAEGAETHIRTFPGKVEASRKVELAFKVPGIIIELPIMEGQKVAKGDVIVQLRPDEFKARGVLKAQLDSARAVLDGLLAGDRPEQRLGLEGAVRAAAAKVANARSEYGGAARLMPSNAIARVEYERIRTNLQVAAEDHKAAI